MLFLSTRFILVLVSPSHAFQFLIWLVPSLCNVWQNHLFFTYLLFNYLLSVRVEKKGLNFEHLENQLGQRACFPNSYIRLSQNSGFIIIIIISLQVYIGNKFKLEQALLPIIPANDVVEICGSLGFCP